MKRKGKQKREEPKTHAPLDSSRLFAYRAMVENIFRRDGPTKSTITMMTRENLDHPLLAGIDPDSWDVEFVLRDGLQFAASHELSAFLSRFSIIDPIAETLDGVSGHEIGHWEYPRGKGFGCPFDKPAYYTSFIEPIHEVLKSSWKFSESFCETLSQRFANAVTDVIDNFNVSIVRRTRGLPYPGQSLFWYLQGQEAGTYTKEYTLFVKLNLALSFNKIDQKLLARFMQDDEELGRAVQRLTHVFTHESMYDRTRWDNLARAYAREAIEFLEEEEPLHGQYSPGDQTGEPMPQFDDGQQGGQAQGRGEKQDGGQKGGQDEEEEPESGDGGKEPGKLGKDLDRKDKEQIMMGRRAGQGIPFFLDTTEALEAYYRGLAKRIPIKAAGKLPAARFPIVPETRQQYDPEVHDVGDVSMGKLFFDPVSRRMVPSVVKTMLSVDIPIRKERRNLPDFLMALVDSSRSMMMQGGDTTIVPWGDRSYYHFGCLTVEGILCFFERENILHKMDVAGAIFSDITLGASGLAEFRKVLYHPVSGGTSLDMQKVLEHFKNKSGAVFPMISDGEIANWRFIRDEFIALAKRNQFFMIQIGDPSRASMDLKAAGLPVKYVTSHADIVNLAIDLTAERYYGAISAKVAGEAKKFRSLS